MESEVVRERTEVRKRNLIWDNVFPSDEIPNKENGFDQRHSEPEDVDEDEMLYVRGASPTFKSAPMRDRSPHQYTCNSHGKRPRSPSTHVSTNTVKRPKEEPNREEPGSAEDRWEKRKKKRKHKKKGAKPIENDIICSYYMKGTCRKGKDCTYSHRATPMRRLELCRYYLLESCMKGNSCLYMHQDFPCRYFHLSKRCYHGPKCKLSHAPLSETMRLVLLKHIESEAEEAAQKKRNGKSNGTPNESGIGGRVSPNSNDQRTTEDNDSGVPCFPQFYRNISPEDEDEQPAVSSSYSSKRKAHSSQHKDSHLAEGRRRSVGSSPDSGCSSRAQSYGGERQRHSYHHQHGGASNSQEHIGSREVKTETLREVKSEPPWDVQPELVRKTKIEPTWEVQSESTRKIKTEPPWEVHSESTRKIKTEPPWEVQSESTRKIKTEPAWDVKADTLLDDNWYSSDEEHGNVLSLKRESPPKKMKTENKVDAPLQKLLSSINKPNNQEHLPMDPRRRNPLPAHKSPSLRIQEPTPPPVINVYGSAICNVLGSGSGGGSSSTRQDSSSIGSSMDSSGRLSLPFKPAPLHAPATEIYASETSHPPIEYHLASVSIPTPDYRHLRFKKTDPQIYHDPRLRKLYRLKGQPSTTATSSDVPLMAPRPDPRRRGSFTETAVH